MVREWSIQQVARLTGMSSRTLRHYDAIGLLAPSAVSESGYRRYDQSCLVRLQRILVLRDLGLSLDAIGEVLGDDGDAVSALTEHIRQMKDEQQRLARRIVSVERTIDALHREEDLVAETMFEGWDNAQYKDEVIERWGEDTWNASNAWWEAKSAEEKQALTARGARLIQAWQDAARAGIDPQSGEAQALAKQQVEWLSGMPGIPGTADAPNVACMAGIAEMYVDDPRFAETYGGHDGAVFVRDAIKHYVKQQP